MKKVFRELKWIMLFSLILSIIFTTFFSFKVVEKENVANYLKFQSNNEKNVKTAVENNDNKAYAENNNSKTDAENNEARVGENIEDDDEADFEISLSLYDSTVDSGRTPLTELIWDATSNQTRILTVQINYRCVDSSIDYNPGDINIKVDNLGYVCPLDEEYSTWVAATSIGADIYSNEIKEYDWSYEYDIENNQYIFTNNNIIEAYTNFEGTIQLVYQISAERVLNNIHYEVNAIMNDVLESSNVISFDFTSQEREMLMSISASGLLAYDGLIENSGDYIWIKYNYSAYPTGSGVRGGLYDDFIITETEDDVRVFNSNLEEIQQQEDGYYLLYRGSGYSSSYTNSYGSYYVAYPIDIYENATVSNTIYWYGKYRESYYYKGEEKELELLSQTTKESLVMDFVIEYDGDLYTINKDSDSGYKSYNKLSNSEYGENVRFNLSGNVIYSGKTYDAIIGDDLLFITNEDGDLRILEEEEYYFEYIEFSSRNIYNANGKRWEDDKYTIKLYVKYAGNTEYEEYDTYTNSDYINVYFGEGNHVVAWYFEFYDLQESMLINSGNIYTKVNVQTDTDVALNGNIYNFNYLKVYTTDEYGEIVLENSGDLSNYYNEMTAEIIGEYDLENYGEYLERDYSSVTYYEDDYVYLSIYNNLRDNRKNTEYFYKDFSITAQLNNDSYNCSGAEAFNGYRIYTLLPEGVEINTTADEIKETFETNAYYYFYDEDGNHMDYSEYIEFIQDRMTVEIVENFRDSNRTWINITIDYSDNPLNSYDLSNSLETFKIPIKIPVESYFLYGNSYEIDSYITFLNENEIYLPYYSNTDYNDIDNDENYEDFYTSSNHNSTYIIMAVSSHQEVKKLVKTEHTGDDYVSGTVMVKNGENYSYKLRIKTGINSVKNLVIYDNLENLVEDSWRGEFLGVDTSFAEEQGYDVRVLYSTEENPGTLLENPDIWFDYDEYVDNSTVKALAFDYGESVVRSASMTCVEINMRVPDYTETERVVRNRCYTNWNAVTPNGEIIDNVVGINSNIVNLAFPESVDDIKVQKIWEDNENELGVRPDEITVILNRDGMYIDEVILNEENNWEFIFEDQLLFNEEENKYTYTIDEVEVNLYASEIVETYVNPVVGSTFEITNTLLNKVYADIKGTKTWADDDDLRGKRPEEITINLYRDGEFVESTTTNEENNWEYEFLGYQLWKNNYEQYEYTIEEVEDYHYDSNVNEIEEVDVKGIEIKFSAACQTESTSYDWIDIFYEVDGTIYKTERLGGSNFAGKSIKIPTDEFYLYWRTDGSVHDYYGFSIDYITEMEDDNYSSATSSTLPSYEIEELKGKNYPESDHNYTDSINQLWHYKYVSEEATEKIINIENTLKRINASILVHHYIEGTETELAEDELIDGYAWDYYETSPSEDIPSYYEVVEIPENATGTFEEEQIEITYYYNYKEYPYIIEYYYDEVIDEEKTEHLQATYQDIIEIYEDKNLPGYKFDKTENVPLTITEDEESNVIKVYYVKDEFEYTIEYYYDGVLDETKTETHTALYGDEITEYPDKSEGYNLENVENLPLIITDNSEENIIKIYYIHEGYSYTINYYYDGVQDESKTEIFYAELGSEIITYPDKSEEIYELEKVETLPLIITENLEENVINVYYIRKDAKVVVNYIDKTTNEIIETEEEAGKIGDEYTSSSKEFEGYKLIEKPEQETVIMTEETIILNYYYVKESVGILEKHIDIKTKEVLYEKRYTGYEGDSYTTEKQEFTGYAHVTNKEYYEEYIKVHPEILEENEVTILEELLLKLELDPNTEYIPENKEGTMTREEIIVEYYYIREIKVVVKYLDKETKEEIAEEVIIEGHEGDSYTTDSKEVENYELVEEPENKEGTMQTTKAEDGSVVTVVEVVYYYEKEKAPEPPKEDPKPEDPKPEEPKPEEPKPEEPKPEEPKPEGPKPEEPKKEEAKPEKPVIVIKPNKPSKEENTANKVLPNAGGIIKDIIYNTGIIFIVITLLRLIISGIFLRKCEKSSHKNN